MKKLLVIVLALTVLISLCACAAPADNSAELRLAQLQAEITLLREQNARAAEDNAALSARVKDLSAWAKEKPDAETLSALQEIELTHLRSTAPHKGDEYGYCLVIGECCSLPYRQSYSLHNGNGTLAKIEMFAQVANAEGTKENWVMVSLPGGWMEPLDVRFLWVRVSDILPYCESTKYLLNPWNYMNNGGAPDGSGGTGGDAPVYPSTRTYGDFHLPYGFW